MPIRLLLTFALACGVAGCNEAPPDAPLPQGGAVSTTGAETPVPHVDSDKPAAPTGTIDKPTTLKLRGVEFTVPKGWRKMPVDGNIPEAELQIPRAEGDSFDGRLTLMSSLGTHEENLARWKQEFTQPTGEPKVEKLTLDGVESTLVDIRGEWKGSGKPIDPRSDYRLLALAVPLESPSSYFVKITGPKATLAAHEEEIMTFLKSVKIVKQP